MNAAISSSVVLASRLSDDLSVFALVLFSVQLFALFPVLRRRLQVRFSLWFPHSETQLDTDRPRGSTDFFDLFSVWNVNLLDDATFKEDMLPLRGCIL